MALWSGVRVRRSGHTVAHFFGGRRGFIGFFFVPYAIDLTP